MSLLRIAHKEGGKDSPSSMRAAMRYCQMCIAMGGDWISYNGGTKRIDFFYLKKTWQETSTSKCKTALQPSVAQVERKSVKSVQRSKST